MQSTSFPTEAMVWINEIDSARNMAELKSSHCKLGRKIPDLEVLDSKIASALKHLLTADFKSESTWKSKRHNKNKRFV